MNNCLIPVSIGELYDKYSILEIKLDKIKDEYKLLNIKKEKDYLQQYIEKYDLDEKYINMIKNINEKLWMIEDNIRDKERNNSFDSEFIMLARSVYKMNDERSRIKNIINEILNSDIVDTKSYSKY